MSKEQEQLEGKFFDFLTPLEKIFPSKLGKIFPSKHKVLQDFCKKNNLSKPINITDTSKGLIANFKDKSQILISKNSQKSCLGLTLELYIGGDGSHRYTNREVIYTLEGKLKGRRVSLETRVSFKEDYKRVSTNLPKPFIQEHWKKTGETTTHYFREDNEKYWFLTDPKK